MIIVTSDMNIIVNGLHSQNTRVVIVSEDCDPGIRSMPGVISLPILLPPSETVYELINDLESGRYTKSQCLDAFICQYQDYLASNDYLNQTLDMIVLSSMHNQIFMYVGLNDMMNPDFPFFVTMMEYIQNRSLGRTFQDTNITYRIENSEYSVLAAALRLLKAGTVDLRTVDVILQNQYTRLPPEVESYILHSVYGDKYTMMTPEMRNYYAKLFLHRRINGGTLQSHKMPAFEWGVMNDDNKLLGKRNS